MSDFLAERLELLTLARLSVAGKSPRSSIVSAALFAFVTTQLTPAEWRQRFADLIHSLREKGLVEDETLALTTTGWLRLQKSLGLSARPSTKTWRAFTKKYLPRLIGPRTGAPPNADLALLVLSERLRIPSEAARTPARLVNSWLRNVYGIRSSQVTLGALRAALLARELGVPTRADLDRVVRVGAAKLAGAPRADRQELTRALTTRWLAGGQSIHGGEREAEATLSGDVGSSAAASSGLIHKIKEAARRADARHFGPDKVFIASVWDALRNDPDVSSLGEGGFKRALIDAHRTGALVLARADLVAAMDPDDVAASETHHLNATYHFIQL
jgi:hypothetical protein